METKEFIDFNSIRSTFTTTDAGLFITYMKEVFKDLSDRSDVNRKKGITKITFLDYIKLPVFIAEKLFSSLDQDNDTFLNSKEFVDGLTKLYLGNFDDTFEMIFNLLDFDKDKIVNKGDIKILISYLPLKTDKSKVEYKYQMESLDEIDDLLKQTFGEKNTMKFSEFKKMIEDKMSDIYLLILCFLYQNIPFNEQNVNMLKVYRRKSAPEERLFLSPQMHKRIPSPNRKSIFSPIDNVLKLNLCGDDSPDSKKEITPESPSISGMKGMVRMTNQKIIDSNKANKVDDINDKIKYSKDVFNSPSVFFKKPGKKVSEFNLENNLVKMEEFNLDDNNKDKQESEITFEDYIYKLSESLNLKKYWLCLIGKDIYYYKSNKKEELLGMHNLSGCYVAEAGEKKIGEERMFPFSVSFPSKTRNYYCKDKLSAMKWTTFIKNSLGYQNFFDSYEMLEDIGEGKFGLVKLGLHKNTKEKVAIKIIKKETMNQSDVELVKSEIDIMKLCRHPNVVRLLDHFENSEYIFIIMEYLSGGDLGDYLNKVNFKVIEQRAAEIMYQLGLGIKYLHSYGILHRDLKPENIMLADNTEKSAIKIMDFGLSKIMGPQERVADGFGTLSFVAPEVLIRQPYNKQIDIWSLGIILYHMLSGTLPFDDENDNEEVIAKMTVFVEVQFPSKYWSKKSSEVVDLISQCLIKDPNKRISIDAFLQHSWIKKYIKV